MDILHDLHNKLMKIYKDIFNNFRVPKSKLIYELIIKCYTNKFHKNKKDSH